jgi:hypothetical protein
VEVVVVVTWPLQRQGDGGGDDGGCNGGSTCVPRW